MGISLQVQIAGKQLRTAMVCDLSAQSIWEAVQSSYRVCDV